MLLLDNFTPNILKMQIRITETKRSHNPNTVDVVVFSTFTVLAAN